MQRFPCAHASHPQWRMAATLVRAQLLGQMGASGQAPPLGLLYITDHYAHEAADILAWLRAELPTVRDWVGTVGVGVAVSNAEYFDEPALAVLLCDLAPAQYRVFSGAAPLSPLFPASTALVHADGATPDLPELLAELAQRMATGYLFGGLSASRSASVQFALRGDAVPDGAGAADVPEPVRGAGVLHGGLSGVAFAPDVALLSRVTQGCLPLHAARQITQAERNLVLMLDGQPALDALLGDLHVTLDAPESAIPAVRATLVGLAAAGGERPAVGRSGHFGADVQVRHIIGLDVQRQGVAVADWVEPGMTLAFCRRDVAAARADLRRICAEIREELAPEELPVAVGVGEVPADPARRILGAVYVSCSGRGGPHFGGPSAEMQLVRHALGDVPLVGFFAGGEIARHHLYGYTGVLTVFTD